MLEYNQIGALFNGVAVRVVSSLVFEHGTLNTPHGPVLFVRYVGIPNFVYFVTPEFLAAIPNGSKIAAVDLGPVPLTIRGEIVHGWAEPEGMVDASERYDRDEAELDALRLSDPDLFEGDSDESRDDGMGVSSQRVYLI